MANPSPILDYSGQPFVHKNGKARQELIDAFNAAQPRRIHATYDSARDGDDFKNYWANTDNFDADSANSRAVREKLVPRSRYDIGSNGYSDGIAQTYATDVVGTGPKLRMQTGSKGFNQLVEFQWRLWAKAVLFRRKLWCQAHAKHQDGESLAVARTNPKVNHPVKLDVVLYETEQCQTPMLGINQQGYIDGIKFDEFGNPEHYDILRQHPGSGTHWRLDFEPERVPAEFVLHWYKLRRPGQHRGIPECASTMNLAAMFRRWREAVVLGAESAADLNILIKTGFNPDTMDTVAPMSTIDIQKAMMTALPMGWDAYQMKAEFPSATHESFNKTLINEQARPKSMPLNKAAANSADYNFASGRLDHSTYYGALDVDRADGDDLVLDPLFDIWFDEAIRVFRWLGGKPQAVGPAARVHTWDWPQHLVADVKAEAAATDTNLGNGSLSLSKRYADCGQDFEDEVQKLAVDYGISESEMRSVLLAENYPSGSTALVEPVAPEVPQADAIAQLTREMRAMRQQLNRFVRDQDE